MIFRDYQLNNNQSVVFFGDYHPYRGGSNPNFDDFSGRILDLKRGNLSAINFFTDCIESIITYDRFAITIVPSHNANNGELSGIARIAENLIGSHHNRINAISCLIRHTGIQQLSHGGNRDINVHLNSIRVNNPNIIRGQDILLLDDVYTTGNSMNACKQLLLRENPRSVRLLSIAKTKS